MQATADQGMWWRAGGRRSPGRRWSRIVVGIVLTLAVAAFVGRAVTGDPGSQGQVRLPSAMEAAGGGVDASAGVLDSGDAKTAGGAALTDAGTGAGLPAGLGDDQVIRTATVEVEVKAHGFAGAFSKVPTIASANGGFVASSTSTRGIDDEPSAGSLVVRVPAANFDAARKALSALGRLRTEELHGEDAGGRLTDLGARLANLRSQEEAIRLLMAKTTNVGETIEVQRQLSGVREQIEQLAGEQARLQDAVALSTITVALTEPGAAATGADESSLLGHAVARAVHGAEIVLSGLIVTVGYLLPLALVVAAAWLAWRPVARRRLVA